jgi:hypothetical protein
LSYARQRGLFESQYEIATFVDDDNWLSPNWAQLASQIMSDHPEVGACGGHIEAVYEEEPPPWLSHFIRRYAVGDQGITGDITDTRGWLWGAGMTIRKSAWQAMVNRGFRTLVDGRKGSRLSSGEDVEMCSALRLSGWRIRYDARLRMQHFIPSRRLTWSYLRGLYGGFGADDAALVPYRYALEGRRQGLRHTLKRIWYLQVAISLARVLSHGYKLLPQVRSSREGDESVLQLERELGRLSEFLRQRRTYQARLRALSSGTWNAL